ncbi:hypothetical protein TSAR_015584 [Trichomalopsis sarcophagae]|uniref:Uncharacterized protein n=1 Tax=Trichomalopsis sarcophagae TaxID=543379 RepID=A0A232EVY8_9HYME|nr:hypothetical protein TSAR_015584 [Trichomalopsis sarcophagae]
MPPKRRTRASGERREADPPGTSQPPAKKARAGSGDKTKKAGTKALAAKKTSAVKPKGAQKKTMATGTKATTTRRTKKTTAPDIAEAGAPAARTNAPIGAAKAGAAAAETNASTQPPPRPGVPLSPVIRVLNDEVVLGAVQGRADAQQSETSSSEPGVEEDSPHHEQRISTIERIRGPWPNSAVNPQMLDFDISEGSGLANNAIASNFSVHRNRGLIGGPPKRSFIIEHGREFANNRDVRSVNFSTSNHSGRYVDGDTRGVNNNRLLRSTNLLSDNRGHVYDRGMLNPGLNNGRNGRSANFLGNDRGRTFGCGVLDSGENSNRDLEGNDRIFIESERGFDPNDRTRNFGFNNDVNFNANEEGFGSDPMLRLTEAIESTLRAVRDNTTSEGNSRLVNRLTSAKSLPTFSGDPLEWVYFKETFTSTSDLGGYTPQENISRLFAALKGEAREAVQALLVTGRDAESVIRTLELLFGNKDAVARKIVNELKDLPAMYTGKSSLMHFAAKLKNAVCALQLLKLTGHLERPDLVQSISRKSPSALKFGYNAYAAGIKEVKAKLDILADFLYEQTELSIAGGIFTVEPESLDEPESSTLTKRQIGGKTNKATAAVTQASIDGEPEQTGEVPRKFDCVICKRDHHKTADCRGFIRETVDRRRFLALKFSLCYKCLESGHW